uniref:Uncharacterized protein n=1 Tax=Oryza sativa subsp. japonica TaxID=39947 RepID=Q339W4_ORYSJ|nr:hypothetical protein LOC_Os10g17810 [Oryza sativa Japonica Group]
MASLTGARRGWVSGGEPQRRRGGRGFSFAYVLRIASVILEVPEAWFAIVTKGSEGRSL